MLRRIARGKAKYVVAAGMALSMVTAAYAIDLGDILKGGLIGVGVKALAPQINKAINTILLNNKIENKQETKVVPILSVGKGAKVGAAQVIGSKEKVAQVKAVAQLEGSLHKIRFKALIPVASLDVTHLRRVYGVGLSALIDYNL